MSEAVQRASRLIAAAQLQNVRLVESNARAGVRTAEAAGEVSLTVGHGARVVERLDNDLFILATVDAKVLRRGESAGKVVMAIRATFELRYRLPPDFDATEEELKVFADLNGVFNAWPYWREYLQSISMRMDLPPFVLPMLRIGELVARNHEAAKKTSRRKPKMQLPAPDPVSR